MVDVIAERRVVLLLLAEAIERLYVRTAVRAVDPGNRGTPLELRDLRGAGQGVADAEQGLDVDAIVNGDLSCGHVMPPRVVAGLSLCCGRGSDARSCGPP